MQFQNTKVFFIYKKIFIDWGIFVQWKAKAYHCLSRYNFTKGLKEAGRCLAHY